MKTTNVGLADGKVSCNVKEALTAIGLGSCVALVGYDPTTHTGGLAHVMLPKGQPSEKSPAKFADVAVPFLLQSMVEAGADADCTQFALFGGATLLTQGQSALLEIGDRNVKAVTAALKVAGFDPVLLDVGGTRGRTVQLALGDGTVTVKGLGQPDRVFVELTTASEVQR